MIDLVLVALPNPVLSNPKMYFPLGILYLAAVAKKEGYSVEIADMRDGEKVMPEAAFYGFSCTTPEINKAKELAKKVKGTTIVGGPHPTLMPQDCMLDFDYVVQGEGEYILLDILRKKPMMKLNRANRIIDLDKIPYPAWDMVEEPFSLELFPGERYGKGQLATTITASRGCPFKCSFCGNMLSTPVRYRSARNILGELEELKKRGVRHFRFEDDNFTLHPNFKNLCLGLKDIGIRWKCHTRSQIVRLDEMEQMKWAGCEEVGLGVESADDNVLKINNKKETCKDHVRAVEIIHRAGLRAKTYFIAGLPGETDSTLKINKSFFGAVKPDKWTLSTFTPYPGCAIYNDPEKFGVKILDWDFNKWWNFVDRGFVYELDTEPREVTWQRYKKFYTWLVNGKWKASTE